MQGVRKGVGEECTVLVFSDEIEQQKNVCASTDLLLLLSTELNSLRGTQGHSGTLRDTQDGVVGVLSRQAGCCLSRVL